MNTISAKYIQFLSAFIAKQDVRYYLNGLLIEKAEKGAFLVATDGRKLAIVYDEAAEVDETILVDVPPLLRSQAKKAKTISFDGDTATANGEKGVFICSVAAKKIDGEFPDWRTVVPKEAENREPSAVNVDYLAVCRLVPKVGKYDSVVCHYHKKGRSVTLRFPRAPEVLAIIMPMIEEDVPEIPSWLTDKAWSPPAEAVYVVKATPKKTAGKKVK